MTRRKRGTPKRVHQENKKVLLKENYEIDIAVVDYRLELMDIARIIDRRVKEKENDKEVTAELEKTKLFYQQTWKTLAKIEGLLLNKLSTKKQLFETLELNVDQLRKDRNLFPD